MELRGLDLTPAPSRPSSSPRQRGGGRGWGGSPQLTQPHLSPAIEWQGHKEPCRPVLVHLQPGQIHVVDGRLSMLRTVQLRPPQQVNLILSSNHGRRALLLKIPKEYDLVWPSQPPQPGLPSLISLLMASPLRSPRPQLQGSSVRADAGRRHFFPRSPPNSPSDPLGPLTWP